MTNIGDVCHWFDDFAPRSLAADWDNTGLLLGSWSDPCRKILCCLTATQNVVKEAEILDLIDDKHERRPIDDPHQPPEALDDFECTPFAHVRIKR